MCTYKQTHTCINTHIPAYIYIYRYIYIYTNTLIHIHRCLHVHNEVYSTFRWIGFHSRRKALSATTMPFKSGCWTCRTLTLTWKGIFSCVALDLVHAQWSHCTNINNDAVYKHANQNNLEGERLLCEMSFSIVRLICVLYIVSETKKNWRSLLNQICWYI